MNKYFPSLKKYNTYSFLNNAASSQIPQQIILPLTNFLINGYTQPFENNIISKYNYNNIQDAKQITNIFLNNNENNKNNGNIIFGNSCSQLMYIFSNSIENYLKLKKGNIIISNFNHESCITPFEKIAYKNNIELKWWNINNNNNIQINYNDILNKVDKNTLLVILPHVSNIIGNILDIKYLKKEIQKINTNTKILIDGVAFMPHQLIDVNDMDIDFYVFSFYKLLGLRISCLYIKNDSFHFNIENQNHIFFNNDNQNYENKLQVGGINYECLSSIVGLKHYFLDFYNDLNLDKELKNKEKNNSVFSRNLLENAYKIITNYEEKLIKLMESFLKNNKEIIYISDNNLSKIPLFSFIYKDYNSKYIVNTLNNFNILIANGSFYCNRLISQLNIDETDGVIRVSCLHYNNLHEINKLINYLKIFKKNKNSEMKNSLNNNIKNSFDYLYHDIFYKNKRTRAFSLLNIKDINNISIVGDASFFQSTLYNSYNGNKLRYYDNISHDLLNCNSFCNIIKEFKITAETHLNDILDYLYVHQIRVYAENKELVNLIPEGIHQDGYNIVGMVCITRKNINGAISSIYDENKEKIYSLELQEGEMLIVNDNKYFHDVSEIQKKDLNIEESYRDIFVFTTLS